MYQLRRLVGYEYERCLEPIDDKIFLSLIELRKYYHEYLSKQHGVVSILNTEQSILLLKYLTSDEIKEEQLAFLRKLNHHPINHFDEDEEISYIVGHAHTIFGVFELQII